jgi:hypothetical protein
MKQVDNFWGISSVKLGRGDTFLFWSDKWSLNDSVTPLKERFPRLFSYVLDQDLSTRQAYLMEDMMDLFYLPLSNQAFGEFNELQALMQANPLSDQMDVWSYSWGSKYTSAQFYAYIHKHIQVPGVYKWIWKSCCIMRTKVFAWLVLRDRLNTRDLLQRRHWHVTDDTHCELCAARSYEDRVHLFFDCNFSRRIWSYLQVDWIPGDNVQDLVVAARCSFNKPFFMEVLITACWNIWLIRNGKKIRQEKPTFAKWRSKFIHDISLLQYRIKAKHRDSLVDWIKGLP